MKQFQVRLQRVLTYSVTVEAESQDDAEDQGIELVEEQGETPINIHAEATVVSCTELDENGDVA